MEALSSAPENIRLLDRDQLGTHLDTPYLMTPVLPKLKPSSESERLLNEERMNGVAVQPIAHSEAGESLPVVQDNPNSHLWKVFGSTFITIFLAELGDKTQVATLLMSAESHAPWVVFTGAAAALLTTSLLGVLVGQWLSSRVSPKTLDTAAGITLALISIWLLLDVVKM